MLENHSTPNHIESSQTAQNGIDARIFCYLVIEYAQTRDLENLIKFLLGLNEASPLFNAVTEFIVEANRRKLRGAA